jgi:hypothetical protein
MINGFFKYFTIMIGITVETRIIDCQNTATTTTGYQYPVITSINQAGRHTITLYSITLDTIMSMISLPVSSTHDVNNNAMTCGYT